MYLENIFIGSEDIRKQLPQESIMFDNVNSTFIVKMRMMTDARNCLRATTAPGMLDVFTDMDAKLEKIQKSLENYLEKKRQQFPRFYFLSSDDLLEILGQAKDPMNVQVRTNACNIHPGVYNVHPTVLNIHPYVHNIHPMPITSTRCRF
eukprot:932771-Prorocentrum_minimum.AAC.2